MTDFTKRISEWLEAELIPKLVTDGYLTADTGATLKNVHAEPLTITGFAFTTPFKVFVEVVLHDGKSKEFKLVVKKTPPLPDDMYKDSQLNILFQNETIAYKEIIPVFSQADKYPKFFYSDMQPLEAVLVMDDFSQYGWKMSNNVYNLSLDHILCAAIELGKFHGECYVMKETKPDAFNVIVSKMQEARYTKFDPRWDAILQASGKRAVAAAKKMEGNEVPESFLTALEKRLTDPQGLGRESIKPMAPLAVIVHGDYLRNNIAFRYENDDPTQKPTEAMMFDMQTMRYCSPMHDMVVLLANSTTHEVRSPNIGKILHVYHEALMEILQKGLSNVPEYYNFEAFYKDFAKNFIYGIHISSGFLPMLYEPIDLAARLEENPPVEEMIEHILKQGGEPVDNELAHQVQELYRMYRNFDLSLE